MEERLIEAATLGRVDLLNAIMAEDEFILDKVVLGSLSRNPLHTAAWYGHTEFVNKLLQLNRMLAWVLDSTDRTALHLAAAQNDVNVVKELIEVAPGMCLARDRGGRIPVHVAAMNGHVEVLKELVQANPHAARARLDRDETILHLCVKLKQPESLRVLLAMIDDKEFVNAKDCEGNTILHLAVIGKQTEILQHVTEEVEIDVNATNEAGHTAKDMLPRSRIVDQLEKAIDEMKACLDKANAREGIYVVQDEWISRNRDLLMVVISLIATIAFQAGLSPAGGVWQENSNGHSAGESVMAHYYPHSYKWYLRCSTLGFVASLTTLLLLNSGFSIRNVIYRWILVVVMILTIAFVLATFAISVFWVTPKKYRHTLSGVIVPAITVFFVVTVILLILHTWYFIATFIGDFKCLPSSTNKVINCRGLTGHLSSHIFVGDRPLLKAGEASPSEPSNLESNVLMCMKEEADYAESQGVEIPPTEHPNSDSFTRRRTAV